MDNIIMKRRNQNVSRKVCAHKNVILYYIDIRLPAFREESNGGEYGGE